MKTNTLIIFLLLLFSSCNKKSSQIIIEGNIPNLPDGKLYLSKDNYINKIDSIDTENGIFNFNYKTDSDEPIYMAIHHIDKNGVFRAISFPTKAKYNNGSYNSQFFLSDSIIIINGKLIDNSPIGILNDSKTKFVNSPEIKAGYQTNALFHTDGDLFDNINKNTYSKVLLKIKKYSNSFHLLYSINEYRNSFTPIQVDNLLNSFNGKITNSDTFLKLRDYNKKRLENKEIVSPILTNQKGEKENVLDKKFDKHLVVFWASWCGPCRQEIPALKNIYKKHKNEVDFVSVSTDENERLWQKALEKEMMPWKQFILSEKSKEYEKNEIFFQLSKSIPYTLLIDKDMKVIKSHVGLMTENGMEEFIKVN
ncbi:TlpA disulfide reductase family protein [Flavobacterium terrigena]|uniref:Thiol-disulfide isomerase or thioredoxin n=1 Tax=Flavobacterium terrigena TaxID=402734 RepID=A0A1H6VTU2_9FLAO|nr:TlpA disulfide reductase family protein [Flavobacterium terrigena]SEJ03602.1 Thiol-disulfide isomerase or thioredoxin [Flavobacterium terrigena]